MVKRGFGVETREGPLVDELGVFMAMMALRNNLLHIDNQALRTCFRSSQSEILS